MTPKPHDNQEPLDKRVTTQGVYDPPEPDEARCPKVCSASVKVR